MEGFADLFYMHLLYWQNIAVNSAGANSSYFIVFPWCIIENREVSGYSHCWKSAVQFKKQQSSYHGTSPIMLCQYRGLYTSYKPTHFFFI